MKTIEILIRPDGQTSVETKGFEGASCQDATRVLEQALGSRRNEQLTAEYYAATNTNQLRHQQGA
ncbi:MAG TPA: DUF2997 domain-containing protein [Pirellulales bacterium]